MKFKFGPILSQAIKDQASATRHPFVALNARGHRFQVLKSKLGQYADTSRLAKFKANNLHELTQLCDYYSPDLNEFYFDRDPFILNLILNYEPQKKLHLISSNECLNHLISEFNYWFNGKTDVYEAMFDDCCRIRFKKMTNKQLVTEFWLEFKKIIQSYSLLVTKIKKFN